MILNYLNLSSSLLFLIFGSWQNWKPDIDECTADRTACDSNQNCVNTLGSYQCECKTGFTMDKVVNACVGM